MFKNANSIKSLMAGAAAVLALLPAIAATSDTAQAAGRGYFSGHMVAPMMARPFVRPYPMVIGHPCRYGHRVAVPRPANPYRGGSVSQVPPHPRQRPCLAM